MYPQDTTVKKVDRIHRDPVDFDDRSLAYCSSFIFYKWNCLIILDPIIFIEDMFIVKQIPCDTYSTAYIAFMQRII